ncbi:hypothetical protein L202_04339 [Cryptococcus amylolentus CBS 6039]|uniref:DNA polymerase eta n=1 Tax=Cryptococcus amylolentus CBS 6039 TaxID=1295533 RepID=A0A1E3HR11_9TREE|nr:hypothetical protein L202_04339 [Cryptococcus amylolentus CBS 6039]ODN78784.1 hypothetical protein L202_04339 [Cryptococcus amylolentus CBS 6039]
MSFIAGPARKSQGNVVPTYRHLLSPQALTLANPLRTIAHCDIDAAYAQFEQVRLGIPDEVPLICAQWQSIIAVNYPARKFGIKRFTSIDDAKKMCPHLVVQHVATYRNGEAEAGYWENVDSRTHKVSLDPYRRESLKILAIFKEMIPKGEVEKASIDEAFLDLTPMVLERLLIEHPYLATVPEDAPNGIDSPLPPPPPIDWSKAGTVFPIDGKEHDDGEEGEVTSEDGEGGERERGGRDTWEDWALCLGGQLMSEVRGEVYNRLHYTCTAGIAHNKSLAKLCSAWKKPNNQTILRSAAVAAFLRDREFTDIRSLGGKLGAAIAQEFDVTTVGDLLTVPLDALQNKFGEESLWIYNVVRGIDLSEVKERVATKSMLASKNIRPSVTAPSQGYHWLSVLAGELNVRLRESREVAPGLWPKTLVLGTRQGFEAPRSRQAPFPFTRNLSTEYILKYAHKLWEEATQPMDKGNMKLNNIALSFTGLEKLEEGQQGIEGFFSTAKAVPKSAKVDPDSSSTSSGPPDGSLSAKRAHSPAPSADPVHKKPRLPTLHAVEPKTSLQAFLAKAGPSSAKPLPSLSRTSSYSDREGRPSTEAPEVFVVDDSDDEVEAQDDGMSWRCAKCKKWISRPEDLAMLEDERPGLLRAMKQEHEDWHFAMSLQNGDEGNSHSSESKRRAQVEAAGSRSKEKPKTTVKKKKEGIQAFFGPKRP